MTGNDAALLVLTIFLTLAAAEAFWPARRGMAGAQGRIAVNFGLGLCNMALAAIPFLSITAIAAFTDGQGWGLWRGFALPVWLEVLLFVLAASLVGYGMHMALHKFAWLWPLHAVHHRDDAVDLSTTLRQHPLAMILSTLAEGALILLLGPAVITVLIARTLVFVAALFQHANIAINPRLSAMIERIAVTPRLHLVHHARDRALHDSNYGEFLTVWDHMFGTFRASSASQFALGVDPLGARRAG